MIRIGIEIVRAVEARREIDDAGIAIKREKQRCNHECQRIGKDLPLRFRWPGYDGKPAGPYHLVNDDNVFINKEVKLSPGVVLDAP